MEALKGFQIGIPQVASVFHLIIWIFAVTEQVTAAQRSKIQRMYGMSKDIINPIVSSKKDLKRLLEYISSSNRKCIIKIVADKKLYNEVMKVSDKDPNIVQVFLYDRLKLEDSSLEASQSIYLSQRKQSNDQFQKICVDSKSQTIEKSPRIAKIFKDLNQCINIAQRQVQKGTKSFRTFQNSHLLIGDFQRINRYRFRLVSFINLKVSDFQTSFNNFEKFAKRELPNLNRHLDGMGKKQIEMSHLTQKLYNYYDLAHEFISNEKQRAQNARNKQRKKEQQKQINKNEKQRLQHQNRQEQQNHQQKEQKMKKENQQKNEQEKQSQKLKKQKEMFSHSIMSIYQEQGLFYHLLNSTLKAIGDKNYNWKDLALPFTHVYNSIKFLYCNEVSKQNEFYLKPFQVFRGGRARRSQLNEYYKYQGKIFLEFYGFMSTSLSAKIVVDKFVTFRNSIDIFSDSSTMESSQDESDEQVIFRIKVKPYDKNLSEKYDFLVNGFFKMGQFQRYGEKQQQVLFNALNVFKLNEVRKRKIRQLFSQEQRRDIQTSREMIRQLSQMKYQEQILKHDFYDQEITVVDLQFGFFYDVILQKNKFNLTEEQAKAKENYIDCMKKIQKYQQFDQGDAYQLTNQMERCYQYLKTKISSKNQSKQSQIMICLLDKKNYFQRLSSVCNKLGKVKQALEYNTIAIKCHTQLFNIQLTSVYNQYYQKLLEMREKSIQIYHKLGDFDQQARLLKTQLDIVRSKAVIQKPEAQLKQSKVYISQAINCYSRGKLQESVNRFKKCSHKLSKIIQKYSFQVEQECCYLGPYLKNLFFPSPLKERKFFYSQFKKSLIQQKQNQIRQGLTEKYGSEQMLKGNCKLAEQLLRKVTHAIDKRNGFFKSRKSYEQFISKFNQQSTMLQQCQQRLSDKDKIIHRIKQKIIKLSGIQSFTEQHSKLSEQLSTDISQLDELSLNSLEVTQNQSFIIDFIKKFKAKEISKRFKTLKQKVEKQNKNVLIEQYLQCAQQIEESIDQLKKQGFVESTFNILKKRNEIAHILFECQKRDLALQEIDKIIQNGSIDDQNRDIELATAYLTKGKILFEQRNFKDCMIALDKAIMHFKQSIKGFQNTNNQQNQGEQVYSTITQGDVQNEAGKVPQVHPQQHRKQDELNNNMQYLEARLLMMKVLLIWAQKKKIQENYRPQDRTKQSVQPIWDNHSNFIIRKVSHQLTNLDQVINGPNFLFDEQIKCSFLEVQFQSYMSSPYRMKIMEVFKPFKQCIEIREDERKKGVKAASLLCADFVLRYHQRLDAMTYFIQCEYEDYLSKALVEQIGSSCYWKILKANYFVQVHKKKNSQLEEKILYDAVNQLKKRSVRKRQKIFVGRTCRNQQIV